MPLRALAELQNQEDRPRLLRLRHSSNEPLAGYLSFFQKTVGPCLARPSLLLGPAICWIEHHKDSKFPLPTERPSQRWTHVRNVAPFYKELSD
ncbi:hypothetical protein VN12_12325 [Pirellula sp. SH-Sr6A]|nr:hypothetical protein VN12_12325 [Pirellula sp. SH-Sr6A]